MAPANAEKAAISTSDLKNHPAFVLRPVTGYDVSTWQMTEKLTNWDALFALGFTSYQALLKFLKDNVEQPVDPVRELLVRLYKIEPSYPIHFQTPSMQDMVDYLFNLRADSSTMGQDDRKRCAAMLAQLLGRNRGSGYRWLRTSEYAENSVSLPIRRLCSKLFSMDPATARTYFWRAAFGMAHARGLDVDPIHNVLHSNGVRIG